MENICNLCKSDYLCMLDINRFKYVKDGADLEFNARGDRIMFSDRSGVKTTMISVCMECGNIQLTPKTLKEFKKFIKYERYSMKGECADE